MIFEKQLEKVPDHPDFGPNRKHFYHAFCSSTFSLPTSVQTTIKTDQPLTGQITLGFRYKLKLTKPLAIVTECGISRSFFKIDQSSGKDFPDTLIHDSQSLRTMNPFGGVFVRFRFGQRGDYLGQYVDLGLSAQVSLLNHIVTKDVNNTGDPKSYLSEKTTITEFKNINPLASKASVRFGFDRFSLIASYRFSRLLNASSVKDLPDFEIGFEISPVRY